MKNSLLLLFLSTFLATISLEAASVDKMTVDLSDDKVQINTGFDGTDLLLFGTTNGADDIVIVIKGPPETNIIRKKTQIAGIWANTEKVRIENTPNFYAIASTRPLSQITQKNVLKNNQIGAKNLEIKISQGPTELPIESLINYRQALVRLKNTSGLFITKPLKITLIDNQLFKTNIHFPANMSTGNYTTHIYSFKNGALLDTIYKPIIVEKIGIGAEVYKLAHQQSALYGITAIIIAIASGWIAAVIFRKV